MVGDGFRNLITRALPENLRSDDAIESMRAEAADDYAGRCLERTRAFSGVRELLGALALRGSACAVLSTCRTGRVCT